MASGGCRMLKSILDFVLDFVRTLPEALWEGVLAPIIAMLLVAVFWVIPMGYLATWLRKLRDRLGWWFWRRRNRR
jgi:hypothetical protein